MTTTEPPTRVTPSPLPLREPVRLYLYSAVGLIAGGLLLAGYITDEMQLFIVLAAAQLLGIAPAVEAARLQVYSRRSISLAARSIDRQIAQRTGDTAAARDIADQLDPIGRHAA